MALSSSQAATYFQNGYRAAMQDVLTILNKGLSEDDESTVDAVREFVETGLGIR